MRRSSFVRGTLIVGCSVLVLAGCSRDPNVRKQKYFESGQKYFYKAHADIANNLTADYASTSRPSDLTTAREHTDLLLAKRPNDPDTHLTIANLLNAQRKYPEEIEEIQRAIALGPNRGDSYLVLALVETRTGEFDAAEANHKKAVDPACIHKQLLAALDSSLAGKCLLFGGPPRCTFQT